MRKIKNLSMSGSIAPSFPIAIGMARTPVAIGMEGEAS